MLACLAAALSFTLPSAKAEEAPPGLAQSCATPGLVGELSDIPVTADTLLPSVRKSLAGMGLLARMNNCAIKVVCVGGNSSDAERELSAQRCAVAKTAIYRGARSPSFPRSLIQVSRKSPGSGLRASTVYVYLK